MKKFKWLVAALSLACALLFGACGAGAPSGTGDGETPEQGGTGEQLPGGTDTPVGGEDGETPVGGEGSGALVVYFSCTGRTEGVARRVAQETGGALHKIEPQDPYTEEDLAYYTDCRADREQRDPTARPAIANRVADMEGYSVLFLGYPIWHGQAPKIIYTFLESYDLAGKTIVPFCTSGSSGVGSSDDNLHPLAPDATWREGRRFSASATNADIAAWLEELDLA